MLVPIFEPDLETGACHRRCGTPSRFGVWCRATRLCGKVTFVPDSHDPTDWLLTKSERGNPRTRLDDSHPGEQAWSEGNLVRP